MWQALWQKWTIDKPALLGDWLWDVFVVQLAATLNRLTPRRMIAFIPVIILVVAYYHSIPVSPGLMLLGDLLAYIDIFTVVLVLSLLSRASTVLFLIKQATERFGTRASGLMTEARRLCFRRERGTKGRKQQTGQSRNDDDEPAFAGGLAWA